MEVYDADIILNGLLYDSNYARYVIPYLKSEYFSNSHESKVFDIIDAHWNQYNTSPNYIELVNSTSNLSGITEFEHGQINELLEKLKEPYKNNHKWLIDKTENFCKQSALYNAMKKSISVMEGDNKKLDVGAIPDIISEALGVCFDADVGHFYLGDAQDRFEYYHKKERHIPFDLKIFNEITRGGLIPKTLNIIMSPPHKGKSLVLCHMAASFVSAGKKVLYITCEMEDKKIAERIDVNLMNVTFDKLHDLPWTMYNNKLEIIRKGTPGELVVREYPATTANVSHFRSLLNELKLKKNFIPDVVVIDYLNICDSSRYNKGRATSYEYIKAVSEEVRGLAQEMEIPILTAIQSRRETANASDMSEEDIAESFGVMHTADLLIALIRSDELDAANSMMCRQIKNRYNGVDHFKRFVIGLDTSKMRLFDCDVTLDDVKAPQDDPGLDALSKVYDDMTRVNTSGFKF